MKTIATSFILILSCSISVFSAAPKTNADGVDILRKTFFGADGNKLCDMSFAFDARAITEETALKNALPLTYTNVTLEALMERILERHTNHVWKYDNDRIYIHPKENAVSLRNCGSIAVTNMPLEDIINDVLHVENAEFFHPRATEISGQLLVPSTQLGMIGPEKVSLELDGSKLWQIMDAIGNQLGYENPYWSISGPRHGKIYAYLAIYIHKRPPKGGSPDDYFDMNFGMFRDIEKFCELYVDLLLQSL